jgi:hypothetical protein
MSGEKKTEPQIQLVTPREYFGEMVSSGLTRRNISTYPLVQNYLVNLLEHYMDARNLFDEPVNELGQRQPQTLAELYLKSAQMEAAERAMTLKKLADRTLYVSGFFGDSLKRKLVDIDYYAEMGCAAYGALANTVKEDTTAAVYRTFAKQFLEFVDVLTYISETSSIQSDQSVLRLYDRYVRTGSSLAKDKLIELGVIPVDAEQAKTAKQD